MTRHVIFEIFQVVVYVVVILSLLLMQCCKVFVGTLLCNIIYHGSQYLVPIFSFLHLCVLSRTGEKLSQLRGQ